MIPNPFTQSDFDRRLLEIISQASLQQIPADDIRMTNLLSGIGIDSLAFMEMIVCIEDEFKITVADEDLAMERFDTVEALRSYVASRMNGV